MISEESLEFGVIFVVPPKTLDREAFFELRNQTLLVSFLLRFCRRACFLGEVHHDLWLTILFPSVVGDSELVLGSGFGVGNGCAEAPPENSDQEIAVLDFQNAVDESLWAFGMEAGV